MTGISLIIPTLNEEISIRACLESLQAFKDLGHELIIVDGGSSDATVQLAEPLTDHVFHCPRGRARQMNFGASKASGNLLVFIHADTLLPGNAVTELARFVDADSVWGRFDVRLSGSNPLFRVIELFMNLRSRVTGIATGDQAMFVSRQLFNAVNGFPDIELMEDISLSANLKKYASPICLTSKVQTSSRRWEEQGIIRTVLAMSLLRLRYALGASPERLARDYD